MISSKQRRFLKSLAHHLNPTVRVGRSHITGALVNETNRALEAHELIKVKIDMDDATDRGDAADSLASATNADVVGKIGKIAILYRERAEKPTIKLPRDAVTADR